MGKPALGDPDDVVLEGQQHALDQDRIHGTMAVPPPSSASRVAIALRVRRARASGSPAMSDPADQQHDQNPWPRSPGSLERNVLRRAGLERDDRCSKSSTRAVNLGRHQRRDEATQLSPASL